MFCQFGQIWTLWLFVSRELWGVKIPSWTLCHKTICNDCLCYSEIICEVWMYKTNICQDTARYVFCLFWSDLSIPGVGQKFHPEYFATKLFVMTACDILRWTVKFECTKIILSQDIVRYVFCLIWSILLIAGVGWKCHPEHFALKLFVMIACAILR